MSKINQGSEDPTVMVGDQDLMQTEGQSEAPTDGIRQIGGVMAGKMSRGAVYKSARETALASVRGNDQLTQAIEAQKYREKRPTAPRIPPTDEQFSIAFGGVVPTDFFVQLRSGNPTLHKVVLDGISGKKNGTGLNIKMPSSKYLTGTEKDTAAQARRILRALRGVIQGRALKGNAFNAALLRSKTRVSALRKLTDPHAYVVQLRNYIQKYNSTDPTVIKQSAQQNIRAGLTKAGDVIISKMDNGLNRTLNFTSTATTQNINTMLEARKTLAQQMQQLGLGASGSSGASVVIPWENVR